MKPHITHLDIDQLLYRDGKIPAHVKLERRIINAMFDVLDKKGWKPYLIESDELVKVADKKTAMEEIFNLDDCRVHVKKGIEKSWIFLVGGNGVDIISDYGINLDSILNCRAFKTEDYE